MPLRSGFGLWEELVCIKESPTARTDIILDQYRNVTQDYSFPDKHRYVRSLKVIGILTTFVTARHSGTSCTFMEFLQGLLVY